MRFVLLTHPVILLLAREVVAERPVMLLVSENKSVSFSSAAYVPSRMASCFFRFSSRTSCNLVECRVKSVEREGRSDM
jgi:hypothetical protein